MIILYTIKQTSSGPEVLMLNSLCPVFSAEQAENCLNEHKGRMANVAHLNAWPLFYRNISSH